MGPAPGQPGFRKGAAMTGGQIFAAAERSVARFWNLSRSQVYGELPRLQRAGLVERAGPPGPRAAQPYTITNAGRDEFRRWLASFISTGPRPEMLRSPLLLAVFFGEFADPTRLRVLTEEYRARHERGRALAEDMLGVLGHDRSLPGAALLRRASYERLVVDWLGEVGERLSDRISE